MDGRVRWRDNVVIERWFRSLKSEHLRNKEYNSPAELKAIIKEFVDEYNCIRPHESLDYDTPKSWYMSGITKAACVSM